MKAIREIKINVEKNFTTRWKQCEKSEPTCIEKPHCGEVEGFCICFVFAAFLLLTGSGTRCSWPWAHPQCGVGSQRCEAGQPRSVGRRCEGLGLWTVRPKWKGTVGFRTSASSHYYTKGGGKKENYNLHFPGRNMPWRCLGACFGGFRHVILQTWFKSHCICGGLTYYNQLTAKPTVGPWNFLSCKNIKHFEGAAKPGFWEVDGLVSAVYPLKPNLFNLSEVKNRK